MNAPTITDLGPLEAVCQRIKQLAQEAAEAEHLASSGSTPTAHTRSPATWQLSRGRTGSRHSLNHGARPVGPGNQGRPDAPLHPSNLQDKRSCDERTAGRARPPAIRSLGGHRGRRKTVGAGHQGDRVWAVVVVRRDYRTLDRELRHDAALRCRSLLVAATQRPSADIIPTSLRNLFGYRWAFRCTTDASSDVIFGHGWAYQGYSAAAIDPTARGVGWLIAEGGTLRRMKAAYLSDDQAARIAEHSVWLRTHVAINWDRDGCGMYTLTHSVPSPRPHSAIGRVHTWQAGDSVGLISFGEPDQDAMVGFGWCRSCAVPPLAVVPMPEGLCGYGAVLEMQGVSR
jgi:hypothetical protein